MKHMEIRIISIVRGDDMNSGNRIFLSYRSRSDGEMFMSKLKKAIDAQGNSDERFGRVYYSKDTEEDGNFLDFSFLKNTEIFVIPYTKDFFKYTSNGKPIIMYEIEAALNYGCKKFIPIFFKDFDEENLESNFRKIFDASEIPQDKLNYVIGAKHSFHYDASEENKLIADLLDVLAVKKNIVECFKDYTPNVSMRTKKEYESTPIYQRLYGIKKLTLLNFAGTAFITGTNVDRGNEYDEQMTWLSEHLIIKKDVQVDIILTEPGSLGDLDATNYKMFPKRLNDDVSSSFLLSSEKMELREKYKFIIQKNFNTICDFKLRNDLSNIVIYTTEMSLPWGVMKSEYEGFKRNMNNIYVTLYAPGIESDDERPAFIVFENDQNTKIIYNTINGSLEKFINQKVAIKFSGHPDISFLFKKPIIHRALYSKKVTELSRAAIEYCLDAECPIEVDLLTIDSTVVVARNCSCIDFECIQDDIMLSDLSRDELESVREELTIKGEKYSQLMTLQELLDMYTMYADKGKIPPPLLIEIKEYEDVSDTIIHDNVIRIVRMLKMYKGNFALHSSNYKVVRYVKNYDIKIPCGIITMEFESLNGIVSEQQSKLHRNGEYLKFVIPDFISSKIGDWEGNQRLRSLWSKYKLPVIGWVARSRKEQIEVKGRYDNIMIENYMYR